MYCECGCGNITKIVKKTSTRNGEIKGQYRKYCRGHNSYRGHNGSNYKGIDIWVKNNQNKNLCKCGCGKYIKVQYHHYYVGIPSFIHGHYNNTEEHKQRSSEMCKKRVGELSPCWVKDRNKLRYYSRSKFQMKERRKIYLRDKGICQHCGAFTLLNVDNQDPTKAHIDHIIAVKDGGTNDWSNAQVLCLVCHKLKHSAKENRVNSGKPRTGNPEPSVQSTKVQRLLESSDRLNYQQERPALVCKNAR